MDNPAGQSRHQLQRSLTGIPQGDSGRLMMNHDAQPKSHRASVHSRPLLLFVEGIHDIDCLKAFNRIFRQSGSSVVDLQACEDSGHLLFLPVGGSNLRCWAERLVPLQLCEFHLYDREMSPVTEARQQIVQEINQRPECTARLTRQRTLENYLHPEIVSELFETDVRFGADDDVSEVIARRLLRKNDGPHWETLMSRSRRRMKDRIKRRLHREVLPRMTSDLLRDRDPPGEIVDWFLTIDRLLKE